MKSINQYFNKINAKLLSRQRKINDEDYSSTNKILTLNRKRDNKISDYLYKASRYIVNQLVSSQITDLIIGHNKKWKIGTNLGRKTNQNFVSITFNRFIDMLTYKCALEGISVHIIDESYTSKASLFDYKKCNYCLTNILISAVIFGGKIRKLLTLMTELGWKICVYDYVENEFIRKLNAKWADRS